LTAIYSASIAAVLTLAFASVSTSFGQDQTLGEVLSKTPVGLLTIIDLGRIIRRVLEALNLTIVPAEKMPDPVPPDETTPDKQRVTNAPKSRTRRRALPSSKGASPKEHRSGRTRRNT
jgi:hypothetical protein